ncbi:hypothetical protein JTE90_018968 [Oedothorax gibbosus]|uniref:Uncharacterized protein n=1 Tax=Oedothorax gibbosus TaxID=931172 RepID=A0AAV6UYT8_9ARAC|nr:hypothetical protein JTE90_018968 [Oedothorax gibbosus]
MGEKELLEFYKNQLDELQTSDDKYKEKVDKYLRELIADRHELVAENLRRGEKISDLQTALVDLQLSCFEEREKFLKVTAENEQLKLNEKKLHDNIYYLLSATKEKDLRDRIIYILDDPKVEIGYRQGNSTSQDAFTAAFKHKKSSDKYLQQQVQQLQAKFDEHSKISQSKTDVLLEDCKIALDNARKKIVQNEDQIRMLVKSLKDAEELLVKENKISTSQTSFETNKRIQETHSSTENTSASKSQYQRKSCSTQFSENLASNASEMRLSLIFLSKIINKCLSLLNNIQSSQVFAQAAKHKPDVSNHKYVNETDITQLQSYVRQCTRLSFDTRNALKLLKKDISSLELDITSDLEYFESVVEELTVATAEVDLININLTRATFFDYLTAPKQPFVKFGVKEINNCSKYVADVSKMVSYLEKANGFCVKAVQCIEKIQEVMSQAKQEKHLSSKIKVDHPSRSDRSKVVKHTNSQQSESNNSKTLNFTIKFPINRKVYEGAEDTNAVLKEIDKTLSKIRQIESGEYIKDNEFCVYLGEQVKALTEKLKELYNEFNVQDIQDQFSEYTSVTLGKLETIAKQSRDAVISAEAQISAHRSNAKNLSLKLKDTEELLRVSINECLSVKYKLQKEKIRRATDASNFREQLQEKLEKVADFDDLENAVKEVISSTHSIKQTKKQSRANPSEAQSTEFDDPETLVKRIPSATASKRLDVPFRKEPIRRNSPEDQYRPESDDPEILVHKIPSSSGSRRPDVPFRKEPVKRNSPEAQYRSEFDDPETLVHKLPSKSASRRLDVPLTKKPSRRNSPEAQYSTDSDESETLVKRFAATNTSKSYPFECMYYKLGSGHKLCDEKIKELRAKNRQLSTELKLLQQEINEEKKLSRMSQEQVTRTNRESAQQSENLTSKLESLEARNASLLEQLNLERSRLKRMEKFHRFEIAGSKTDIKNLKTKIQDLEKQLLKAVLIFEHDKNDLELLKSVHTTAQNSKQAVEAVRRLKRKVYELETDIKHL